MRARRLTPLLLALTLGAPARADEPAAPVPLTPEAQRLADIQAHLHLTDEDLAWRQVGWLPSLGDAVVRARAEGKPIFLWAMNGHPLGCV